MAARLETPRLVLRPWREDDAAAALAIYGREEVTRWLSPAMDVVRDQAAMLRVLRQWAAEEGRMPPPAGRWAVQRREDGDVVGAVSLLWLPPGEEDLELAWSVRPSDWGSGYATEAGAGVSRWAFTQDADEVFSVVRPGNKRGVAAARRLGMEWVGETEKYYGLRLQVYRLRPPDLAEAAQR